MSGLDFGNPYYPPGKEDVDDLPEYLSNCCGAELINENEGEGMCGECFEPAITQDFQDEMDVKELAREMFNIPFGFPDASIPQTYLEAARAELEKAKGL